jgi:1-acyl-sn-glycerol-3-phosphate acyltransferase
MIWFALVLCVLLALSYVGLRACEAAAPADWGNRWTNRIAGFIAVFCRHYHHLQFDPLPLPAIGGAVVAANHISGLDPFLLIAASPRPLRFLIAREQYERWGLKWLFRRAQCIPVDREKRPERALREALRALRQGEVIAVFPQGHIQRPGHETHKLKGGVARLAHKVGCLVYPVQVAGVRAVGHTVWPILIPGTARLRALPAMDCADLPHADCLRQLSRQLLPSVGRDNS